MTCTLDLAADKEVFLNSLDVNEEEFYRLLRWSVLPEEGFAVYEIQWLERCLDLSPNVTALAFLDDCVEKGIVEPVPDPPSSTNEIQRNMRRYQLEVPWHRLVGQSLTKVLESTLEAFVGKTIEKLRRITLDFTTKKLYLQSCRDYDRYSRLILHVLSLVLLPGSQHFLEEDFWQRLFRSSFFGRVNAPSIIGAFWYLQDRMEEEDRERFLSLRDAMLAKVHWVENPRILSIVIKLEKVLRYSKCSKKYGNVEERKPLLGEVQKEFNDALGEFEMEQEYPSVMGYYYDVMLDILEKAPIVDGTARDKAWKEECRKLCSKSKEYWEKARQSLEGSEEQNHVIIHHIHAISKEAHLQMMSGEMNESDLKHELVLKEAEARYGDHKITATFASFYGDFYLKRDERRANYNKEDDYRRAMQFFMKEFRILQHCDERDRSRLKINLGKQGYVKGLMGHGKEALVDAKKAFLMGEDDKDWRSEGSGFLRYNYLNVIFLHWMGIEENARHSMGTKWWMTRELKALQLPEHSLSALRESNAALIPTNSGVKPNTHEELVHNMIIAVYRVQARPRLLSPRIHPGHHRFWKNVVEKYVVTEDDQLVALEAVKAYMDTGGVIVLRKRIPPPVKGSVSPDSFRTVSLEGVSQITTALREVDVNNNALYEVPKPSGTDKPLSALKPFEAPKPFDDAFNPDDADKYPEETRKLFEAASLLREAEIVSSTVFSKWKALRGIQC